ncbi:uncharacterized protein JCM10292_006426 [Rhodotorula paludigena]|uniref:uncharacterized protein n=1 Tax=Rhodotorula paludigena TaxID=86838 RepID=UPI00317C3BC0
MSLKHVVTREGDHPDMLDDEDDIGSRATSSSPSTLRKRRSTSAETHAELRKKRKNDSNLVDNNMEVGGSGKRKGKAKGRGKAGEGKGNGEGQGKGKGKGQGKQKELSELEEDEGHGDDQAKTTMVQMSKGKRDTLVQLGRDRHAALAAADQVKPDTGLPKIIRQTTAGLVNGVKAVMSKGGKYNACKLKIQKGKEKAAI